MAIHLFAPLSLLIPWGTVWGYPSLLGYFFDNVQTLPSATPLNIFLITFVVLPAILLMTVSGGVFVTQLYTMTLAPPWLRGLVGCGLALVLILYMCTLTSFAVSVVKDFKQPAGLMSVALPVLVEVAVVDYLFRSNQNPVPGSAV